jgi:hypothetical protein
MYYPEESCIIYFRYELASKGIWHLQMNEGKMEKKGKKPEK